MLLTLHAHLRYQDTSLLIFPETILSKRIEDGEQFTVFELYESLLEELGSLITEHFND